MKYLRAGVLIFIRTSLKTAFGFFKRTDFYHTPFFPNWRVDNALYDLVL